MSTPISDEQLQAIEKRSADRNKPGCFAQPIWSEVGTLQQALRERDATIADLRKDAPVGHASWLDAYDNLMRDSNDVIASLRESLNAAKSEAAEYALENAELRKPVAQGDVEVYTVFVSPAAGDTIEYRDSRGFHCTTKRPPWGSNMVMQAAYDALAQNHAREVNARDAIAAEMRGLRERLESRERVIDQWERVLGIENADATRTVGSEIKALQERERQLRQLLTECRDLIKSSGQFDGRQYVSLGVAVNRALAASPAPVESERERTPEQYAIEHGRYLATAAKSFMDDCNNVWSAQQAVDDDETDTQNEADGLLNRLDEAKESQSEGWRSLENAIYEFTKRADRAYPLPQPAASKCLAESAASGNGDRRCEHGIRWPHECHQCFDLLVVPASFSEFPCCGGSDESPPEHTQDCNRRQESSNGAV